MKTVEFLNVLPLYYFITFNQYFIPILLNHLNFPFKSSNPFIKFQLQFCKNINSVFNFNSHSQSKQLKLKKIIEQRISFIFDRLSRKWISTNKLKRIFQSPKVNKFQDLFSI